MKSLYYASIFLFFSSGLAAQIKCAVSAGANYSEVFIPEHNRKDRIENLEMFPILNFNGGIYAEYDFGRFVFSSGFFVSRRGSKIGKESILASPYIQLNELQFYFWEIPCLVRFPLLNRSLEVGGGFVNSILSDADVYLATNIDKPYQIDIKALFRWNMTPRLNMEAGYTLGGLNHFDDYNYFGHSVFNLNVGYRLFSVNFKHP